MRTTTNLCEPSGVGILFSIIPVVSLANSLNHRLMDLQASGLPRTETLISTGTSFEATNRR